MIKVNLKIDKSEIIKVVFQTKLGIPPEIFHLKSLSVNTRNYHYDKLIENELLFCILEKDFEHFKAGNIFFVKRRIDNQEFSCAPIKCDLVYLYTDQNIPKKYLKFMKLVLKEVKFN
jgi:hypothetical protein